MIGSDGQALRKAEQEGWREVVRPLLRATAAKQALHWAKTSRNSDRSGLDLGQRSGGRRARLPFSLTISFLKPGGGRRK